MKTTLNKLVFALGLLTTATSIAQSQFSMQGGAGTEVYIESPSILGKYTYNVRGLVFTVEFKNDWSSAIPMEVNLPENLDIVANSGMAIASASTLAVASISGFEIYNPILESENENLSVAIVSKCGQSEAKVGKFKILSESATKSSGLLALDKIEQFTTGLTAVCPDQLKANSLIQNVVSYSMSKTKLLLRLKNNSVLTLIKK